MELVRARVGRVTGVKRMAEPYHSIYLMGLDRYNLADMWLMSGPFYLNGGLVMRQCCGQQAKPAADACVPAIAPLSNNPGAAVEQDEPAVLRQVQNGRVDTA